ncbi:hypothetical protein DACRYDRAFT_16138 [Dacryopinax primogenitus]|uniref:Transmembrane protein n=1 Tax=Dacryopinax primogenitus (strain DJM 731) TaxID=1858805 RepID=M5FZX2_DACPD|nr:uncharacterized protein DACRYDRAFT_16138 [Dacryopinax primogenitus]EJU01445.1 hypothetical protein DACRYDRAFT_16138 [Dacryopinax primogenitus]
METALAYLFAIWINALLHGIYLTLFFYWLSMPKDNGLALYFTVTSWLVFVFTNIDAARCLIMLIQGFWQSLDGEGPQGFFNSSAGWQFTLQEFNYLLLILVCDALMVYRVWRLYGSSRWIVTFPVVLLIAETVLRFVGDTYLALSIMAPFQETIAASLGTNTAVQVVITILLGYRLLFTEDLRLLPPEQRSRRFRLTRAIVESGLIISVCLIFNLAFFANGQVIHWAFNLSIPHLYAITSVAIVVRLRVAQKRQKEWDTVLHTVGHSSGTGYRRSAVAVRALQQTSVHEEDESEVGKPYPSRIRTGSGESLELGERPFGGRKGTTDFGTLRDGIFVHTEETRDSDS